MLKASFIDILLVHYYFWWVGHPKEKLSKCCSSPKGLVTQGNYLYTNLATNFEMATKFKMADKTVNCFGFILNNVRKRVLFISSYITNILGDRVGGSWIC